ncbi:MAG TPA: prolyl oligopeptidase family serine peptidase, partial [Sandaracinaceae bacterium LLY-WYZ-13_1]|nr:prolyl oligopeptidase family serine peptidase [Sandaracinaceae bacterium LLY-WYZ-13_1]
VELEDAADRGDDVVYLGATLLVPRATRAFVMVGMRGKAAVLLDGRVRARGESADRFRRDRLVVPLPLEAGEHRLVLRFEAPERGRWRGSVRWLDARQRPGTGNVAVALGRPSEDAVAARLAAAVRFEETHELAPPESDTPANDFGGLVRIRADLPGGGPRAPVTVAIGDAEVTLAPRNRTHPGVHEVVRPMPERGVLRLRARVDDREEILGRHLISDRRALRAASRLRDALAEAPEGARPPIAWRMNELLRAVREHDPDQAWRNLLAGEARRIRRLLRRGRDPFGRVRGYERMAFFSRLDDTAQEYELFVPPAYRERRAWPLLVTLHGYKGNAGDYFRNTFGLARQWQDGETLLDHGRHGEAPTRGPMIVIAPTGRGQAFYRHAGEIDVLEAIADVRRRFHVDEDRIYITGGSMGGTGAAYLPYRHPDLFAAAAALAGYHDQRVRVDTNHEELSEVERFLQARRSDVDWAENGLHLPTLLVRGTRDRPLAWTRVLAARLEALDYPHEHREPESGHNVWTDTYEDGAIFPYLGRHRRPSHPRHVRLRTARERTREAWWVRVEQREAPDRFAEVDARVEDGAVVASVEGARAVTFSPRPPLVAEGAPITVRIGDDRVRGEPPITLERAGDGWRRATGAWPQPGARREGTGGPIRDVYHEPLIFVVGTRDPDHTALNRVVARHWARPKGWIVDYPIVDDVDVTDAMIEERVLVLIGPPSSNAVHARIADRLPIRVTDEAVRVGETAHRGDQVGTVFVSANPLNPDRSVLVIAGPRPLGTWRSVELPDILPDYVVYDERVSPARDQWACGGTGCTYRDHGFFDMRWALRDPG